MTSTESIVKLTGPESWKEWNLRFINMAQDNQLWDLINPASTSKGDFMERPTEPRFADYPKLLDTPASSTRSSSATPAGSTELTDTEGTPRKLSEMTTAGKEQYRQDVANFQFNWRRYETQGQRISNVSNWVQKTVATHIYNATCKHDKQLHQWYDALKERAGTDNLEDLRRALERYNTAIRVLIRKPKDALSWLSSWETAIGEAQEAKVPGTENSQMWWLQFEAAIRGAGYESWCEAYAISNQALIDNNRLTVHKLVKDFRERIRKDGDSKPRTITKGAFVTFAGQTSDEEERDLEPRRSRRNPTPAAPRRSKSRSPPARSKRRRNNDGPTSGCPACDNKHSLEECWAARPEIRPDHRYPSRTAEARAQERIKHDAELRKEVERLRKRVKVEEKDTAPPLKSALKESSSQSRAQEEH
jgi:hypothetical protein